VLELLGTGRENRRGDPAQETEHDASEKRSGDQESNAHGRLLLCDMQIGILREVSTAAPSRRVAGDGLELHVSFVQTGDSSTREMNSPTTLPHAHIHLRRFVLD